MVGWARELMSSPQPLSHYSERGAFRLFPLARWAGAGISFQGSVSTANYGMHGSSADDCLPQHALEGVLGD